MMLDAMRIKIGSRRRGVPKDKLLEVEAMGTKGQVAEGGGYGVPKDKLLEVEALGYQRTSCWRWRLGVTKGQVAGGGG